MKKVFVLLTMMATLLLVACTQGVQTNARAVVSSYNPTTNSVSFKVEVRDPNNELENRDFKFVLEGPDNFRKEVNQTIAKNVTKTISIDGLSRTTAYALTVFGTKDGAEFQLYKTATAFETLAQGDTQEDPIFISTPEKFQELGDKNGTNSGNNKRHFKLTADLDFEGAEFTPLFASGNPFTGSFDGDGYTIKNLKITAKTNVNRGYLSIFGYASRATIKNINFENILINNNEQPYTGIHYVGVVVSKVSNNDFVMENITIDNASITIRHNINQSALNRNLYAGLVGGSLQGKLANITVTNSELNITQNAVNGTYKGNDAATAGTYVGGIAGLIEQDKGISINKLAVIDSTIDVYVNQDKKALGGGLVFVGGIFGAYRSDKAVQELVSNAQINVEIKRHADTQDADLDTLYVGGIMGTLLKANASNLYYFGDITVQYDAVMKEIFAAHLIASTTRSTTNVLARGSIMITAPEVFNSTLDLYNYLSFGPWNKFAAIKILDAASIQFNDQVTDLSGYEVIADGQSALTSDFVKNYLS